MLGGVYREKGRVVLEILPVPPIEEDEVLVRVEACGICGTDLKKIHYGLLPPPRVFGHEIAGKIAKVGRKVRNWREGDRVAVLHHVPCLKPGCIFCKKRAFAQCPIYKQTGTTAGFEPAGGGFAEFVRVSARCVAHGLIRIPAHVSAEEATFLEPLNTCLKGFHQAQLQQEDNVLILGLGPIGLLYTMICSHFGLSVIGVDPLPKRRNKALVWGAKAALSADEVKDYLTEKLPGKGADVTIVAVPNSRLIPTALEYTRPAGKVLLFAQTHLHDFAELDMGVIGMLEKQLIGSYSGDITLLPQTSALLFERKFDVRSLISHRLPLRSIAEAIELAFHPSNEVLKVVITS